MNFASHSSCSNLICTLQRLFLALLNMFIQIQLGSIKIVTFYHQLCEREKAIKYSETMNDIHLYKRKSSSSGNSNAICEITTLFFFFFLEIHYKFSSFVSRFLINSNILLVFLIPSGNRKRQSTGYTRRALKNFYRNLSNFLLVFKFKTNMISKSFFNFLLLILKKKK